MFIKKKQSTQLPIVELPKDKKRLLLHSCCAPCSCEIMETLKRSNIHFTVFFYNPNIDTKEEYEKRKKENAGFSCKLNIPFIDGDYDAVNWIKEVKGLETEPERGKRCEKCFEQRLFKTAKFAYNNNFDVFTSSLGISRWKDFEQITKCGIKAASNFPNLLYWDYNWRKKGGSNRMSEITKREKFYQQKYCGCIFSK